MSIIHQTILDREGVKWTNVNRRALCYRLTVKSQHFNQNSRSDVLRRVILHSVGPGIHFFLSVDSGHSGLYSIHPMKKSTWKVKCRRWCSCSCDAIRTRYRCLGKTSTDEPWLGSMHEYQQSSVRPTGFIDWMNRLMKVWNAAFVLEHFTSLLLCTHSIFPLGSLYMHTVLVS